MSFSDHYRCGEVAIVERLNKSEHRPKKVAVVKRWLL